MLNHHSEKPLIRHVVESQHPILKDLDQDAVFYDHSIEFGVLCL